MINLQLIFVLTTTVVFPAWSESIAGTLIDYRNSFLSYEQKGFDTCPYTYYQVPAQDFAHVLIIETPPEGEAQKSRFCVGSIVSEQFAIVPAHCVSSANHENVKLHTRTNAPIMIENVYLHPDYKLASAEDSAEYNLAILKFNSVLSFSQDLASSCLWDSESLALYTKVQEIDFDYNTDKLEQNTTICSGDSKNKCLETVLLQWCQGRSRTGILQIRELGRYKMHPLLVSLGCTKDGRTVPISKHLPWIREVTKSTQIEYNLTDVGLGEKCFKSDGTKGVCLTLNSCPQVLQQFKTIKNYSSSNLCGFDGADPLNCCSTDEMLVGPDTATVFNNIVREVEQCEELYGDFRRTPDEHQVHPHLAIVDMGDSVNCSATLVTTQYLLTSAQCVLNLDIKTAHVWIGLSNAVENVLQKMQIHSIFTHPKFGPKTSSYNVAVIRIMHPVLIQPFTIPACMWREKSKMPTTLETVSYNDQREGFRTSSVRPLYYSDCRRLHNSNLIASEMCAHHYTNDECISEERQHSCQKPGSGLYSTLFLGESLKPVTYVVGIYSQGYKCDKGGPAIYTRVNEYYDWIKSVIYLTSQNYQ